MNKHTIFIAAIVAMEIETEHCRLAMTGNEKLGSFRTNDGETLQLHCIGFLLSTGDWRYFYGLADTIGAIAHEAQNTKERSITINVTTGVAIGNMHEIQENFEAFSET
jgi:hypothetical protein